MRIYQEAVVEIIKRFDKRVCFSFLLASCTTVYAGLFSLADRQDAFIKIVTLFVAFTGSLLVCRYIDIGGIYRDAHIAVKVSSAAIAYLSLGIIRERFLEDASYYLQKYVPMAHRYHMQFYNLCLIVVFVVLYIYFVYLAEFFYRSVVKEIICAMDAEEKLIAGIYISIMILTALYAHTHSSAFSYAQYMDGSGNVAYAQYDAIMDCDSRATFFSMVDLRYSDRHPFFYFVAMPEYVVAKSISYLFCRKDIMSGFFLSVFSTLKLAVCGICVKRLLNSKWAMLILYTSYPFILYAIVVERHVFMLFWMVVMVYLFCQEKQKGYLPIILSAGANTIGLAITPILIGAKSFGAYIKKGIAVGAGFLYILIINGKLYSMLQTRNPIARGQSFINRDSLLGNLARFTWAVRSCFAGVKIDFGAPYATYYDQSGFSLLGFLILVICLGIGMISAREKYARISFYWVVASVTTFVLIGFASYSSSMHMICFSWAFVSLLLMMVRYIRKWLHPCHFYMVDVGGWLFLLWQIVNNMETLGGLFEYATRFNYIS